jgi:hypothetical protein
MIQSVEARWIICARRDRSQREQRDGRGEVAFVGGYRHVRMLPGVSAWSHETHVLRGAIRPNHPASHHGEARMTFEVAKFVAGTLIAPAAFAHGGLRTSNSLTLTCK